jgi:hypothetical protein
MFVLVSPHLNKNPKSINPKPIFSKIYTHLAYIYHCSWKFKMMFSTVRKNTAMPRDKAEPRTTGLLFN